jgi:hypothetical protein
MKLRLQSNSIRLRLKRGEVEQLTKTGRVEEKIIMGSGTTDIFHYVLQSTDAVSEMHAVLEHKEILVLVPVETVSRWAAGNEVGMETSLRVGDHRQLQVLIEKDFACLTGTDAQNADTFPNPLAGTKC